MNKRMATFGARPRAGVHPKWAVCGDAVKSQIVFFECVVNFLNRFERHPIFRSFQHEIAGLGASGTGLLGELQEFIQRFRSMLRAFDTGVKDCFGHD